MSVSLDRPNLITLTEVRQSFKVRGCGGTEPGWVADLLQHLIRLRLTLRA